MSETVLTDESLVRDGPCDLSTLVAECDYQLAVRDCGEGYFQPGHTGPVVYADGSVETE
jgi:hypothetical protein